MKLFKEPLVHFLLFGALLFGAYAALGKWSAPAPQRIVVGPGLIENLKVSFQRGAQRPPTPAELDGLIDDYVREEILCREAMARGLDQGDPIIRRRLRQKMEFLTDDGQQATTATDSQLEAFMRDHARQFNRDGKTPALDKVRGAVTRAWDEAQRQAVLDAAYARLKVHYQVTIERPEDSKAPADGTGNS